MLVKSKILSELAVANQSGAMEADTILKNGRSSKSQMSRRNIFCLCKNVIITFVCIFAFHLFFGISVFAQNMPPITIHVETAGTLHQLIAENRRMQITDLTLTGNLNAADIAIIRQMAGSYTQWNSNSGYNNSNSSARLEKLNIENANIFSGGGNYNTVFNGHGKNNSEYTTKNNVISTLMFAGCTKLKYIILPSSIIQIESCCAFIKCSNLTHIVIPENVSSIGDRVFADCTKLVSIRIQNPTPPTILNSTFSTDHKETVRLYVPKGSRDAYWLVWGFDNVIEE